MAQATKGLGKGLSALMSEEYASVKPAAVPVTAPNIAELRTEGLSVLPIDKLVVGTYQPRRHFDEEVLLELADSIEKNGIMQPIIVRAAVAAGRYEIIAGERRWRAAKLAKLKTVPAIIRAATDSQALELALVENIQRQDLNPLEEGAGYQRLMDEFKYTQEKLASIVGKSRSHIANLLRLLTLPEKIKKLIDSGDLSMGHARALVSAKEPEKLAAEIVAKGLSVRQTEEWVKSGGTEPVQAFDNSGASGEVRAKKTNASGAAGGPAAKSDDVLQIEEMLAENLGLKVSINTRGAQSGDVVIAYDSLLQLDTILRRLGGSI